MPSNDRRNLTPLASPDGSQVAFLSAKKGTNGMGEYGLYLVDSLGGEPTKLESYIGFNDYTSDGGVTQYKLLDWIE